MGYTPGSITHQRWLPAYNAGTDLIPPHAVVQLFHWGFDDCFGFVKRDVDFLIRVERIGKEMVTDQNAAGILFNGRKPIPPKGFGSVTRDFPALTIHDGNIDKLGPGYPCGPALGEDKKGLFWLMSSGSCFTCMGHDATTLGDPWGLGDGIHGIWVTNEHPFARPASFMGSIGGVTLEAGDYLNPRISPLQIPENPRDPSTVTTYNIKENDDNIEFTTGGVFMISFNGRLSASKDDVDNGTVLEISAILKRPPEDEQAANEGEDAQEVWIVKGSTSQIIVEYMHGSAFPLTLSKVAAPGKSVSFAHPVYVKSGDKLYLKNTGSTTITVEDAYLSVSAFGTTNYKLVPDDGPKPP